MRITRQGRIFVSMALMIAAPAILMWPRLSPSAKIALLGGGSILGAAVAISMRNSRRATDILAAHQDALDLLAEDRADRIENTSRFTPPDFSSRPAPPVDAPASPAPRRAGANLRWADATPTQPPTSSPSSS